MGLMAIFQGYLIGKQEAAKELGIKDRRLVGILIRAHKIPTHPMGTKHCLDATGMELLRRAYSDFLSEKSRSDR